jgi:hypothetical protein
MLRHPKFWVSLATRFSPLKTPSDALFVARVVLFARVLRLESQRYATTWWFKARTAIIYT